MAFYRKALRPPMKTTGTPLIAALALSLIAIVTSSTAAAQCLGMSVLGRINSVSGNPFQAEVHMTISIGTTQEITSKDIKQEIISRDSHGRVRIDHQMEQFGPRDQKAAEAHHCVTILDPVSHGNISLDTITKVAIVQRLSSRMLLENRKTLCQSELEAISNKELDDLGHQAIDGIDMKGLRERPTDSRLWCSEELQAVVVLEFPVKFRSSGVSRIAMTDVQRVEPDAALFVVPPDYKSITSPFNSIVSLPPPPVGGGPRRVAKRRGTRRNPCR